MVPRGEGTLPTGCAEVLLEQEKRQHWNNWLIGEGGGKAPLLGLTLYFNKQFKGKRNSFLSAAEELPLRC